MTQSQTIVPLSRWHWLEYSEIWGVLQWISSPMQAWHAGGVTVTPDPWTGFKAWENCGFLLRLGLLVYCHQCCLVYLAVEASASPPCWGVMVRAMGLSYFSPYFLTTLLPLSWFLMFFPLFLSSEYSLLFVSLTHPQSHVEEASNLTIYNVKWSL